MGKSSSTNPTASQINVNGQTKANTYRVGDTMVSNYNMSDYEKSLYDYAQKTLSEIVPNVNTFSQSTKNDIDNQIKAKEVQGIKHINDIYNPMIDSLKTDIASRFGNLDNSSFLDKLGAIESSRSQAVNSLAQDLVSQRDSLVNNELNNRYNFINLLTGIQNGTNSNVMNYLSSALNTVSTGNSLSNSSNNSFLDSLYQLSGLVNKYR